MKKIAIEINDLLSKDTLDNSDLVYLGYLSECLYSKAVNQYVKSNLTENSNEVDISYLLEEYGDLVSEGHLFDCNSIF